MRCSIALLAVLVACGSGDDGAAQPQPWTTEEMRACRDECEAPGPACAEACVDSICCGTPHGRFADCPNTCAEPPSCDRPGLCDAELCAELATCTENEELYRGCLSEACHASPKGCSELCRDACEAECNGLTSCESECTRAAYE